MILPIRVLAILAFLGNLAVQAYLPGEYRFPSLSHAGGLYGNPAALPAFDSRGWMLGYQETASDFNQFRLGLHGQELGASFYWVSGPDGFDHSEWTLIDGFSNSDRSWFAGHRLSVIRSSEFSGNTYAWSPGFLWRPASFLAAGFHSEALLQNGTYQNRLQHLGASLRPLAPLTLSWSTRFENKTQLQNFSTDMPHALLLEFDLAGFELGLSLPLNDPWNDGQYALQISLPFSPYTSLSITGEHHDGDNALRGVTLGGHSARSPQGWKKMRVVRVPLGGRIAEVEPGFSLLGSQATGLSTLRNHFTFLQTEVGANPIVFDFSGYSGGPAAALEIRRGIQGLRATGKKTVAFVNDLRPSVLLAAGAADQIVLQPSARVDIRGLSSEVLYYKGFLDWIGVKAELLRHGRYKSAIEPYTADSMSQEARSDLEGLLKNWWGIFRDSIAVSRQIPVDSLEKFTNQPAITATAALELGLVDTILYLDDVPAFALQKFFRVQASPLMVDWAPTSESQFSQDWTPRPRIAVLNIEGAIVDGSGGVDRLSGTSMAGGADLMNMIDQLRKEGDYAALILRINSPGGSAQASDEVWHRLRKLASDGMPIIASIGDMAASGGYYLACAADDIVAEPTSIVGSIGIFGGKVNASGLLEKLRLRYESVSTHPSANAESPTRGFSEEEKQALQNYMDTFYGRFVKIVANARGMDSLAVDSLGEGRVFTAAQGVHNGLVDQLGGIAQAVAVAKKRAGIAPGKTVELVPLTGGSDLSFRNLADQARLLPWRSALEGTRLWSLWIPEFRMTE